MHIDRAIFKYGQSSENRIIRAAQVLQPLAAEPVSSTEQSVWDAVMAEHHPTGFQRAIGAHQRYRIYGYVSDKKVV